MLPKWPGPCGAEPAAHCSPNLMMPPKTNGGAQDLLKGIWMYNTLTLSRDDRGVATLMLNRPEKHNAMSGEMLQELKAAAAALAADRSVRVVVLTGAGKSFCAGGDLGWMQAQMTADAETRAREARVLAEMLMAINTLPQPVIGAIQGNAFGGGVGMASVCDVAIDADHIKMGLTETRLGLIPATIGP